MRISSVSENESYLYSTLKNSTSKIAQATISNAEELYGLTETQAVEDVNDKEQYSAAEHMAMMQSSRMMPEYVVSENEDQEEAGDISSIDADGDGTISTDEYDTMISQMGIPNALDAEEFFKQYDLNEDGEISADEMPEPGTVGVKASSSTQEESTNGISSIDADDDGTISTDEYESMISQMGIPNALDAEEFFKQYDLNEDGEISADEMPEPGTVGKGMDTTEDVTETEQESEYFNNRLLMGLQNYEKNYESMFETLEGTQVNGLA